MSDSDDENTNLYAKHLKALRAIEANRTKLLIEALATLKNPPLPQRDPDAEQKNLRDFFAAHALAGSLASFTDDNGSHISKITSERHAKNAFLLADAMLKERTP